MLIMLYTPPCTLYIFLYMYMDFFIIYEKQNAVGNALGAS